LIGDCHQPEGDSNPVGTTKAYVLTALTVHFLRSMRESLFVAKSMVGDSGISYLRATAVRARRGVDHVLQLWREGRSEEDLMTSSWLK
jgi:hypothetical protein